MKFLVFFFLCFVALSAAAPQLGAALFPFGYDRTIVAGPSVINGLTGFYGGRVIAPGGLYI